MDTFNGAINNHMMLGLLSYNCDTTPHVYIKSKKMLQ